MNKLHYHTEVVTEVPYNKDTIKYDIPCICAVECGWNISYSHPQNMQKLNTNGIPNKNCSSFYSVQIVSSCSRHLNIQGGKKDYLQILLQ
jgi:hypothetical protein